MTFGTLGPTTTVTVRLPSHVAHLGLKVNMEKLPRTISDRNTDGRGLKHLDYDYSLSVPPPVGRHPKPPSLVPKGQSVVGRTTQSSVFTVVDAARGEVQCGPRHD